MIIESPKEKSYSEAAKTPEQSFIKVFLVDDHQMMRSGLRNLINSERGLKVIAEASDGSEVLDQVKETSPDVIIMDVDMPIKNGIEATYEVKKLYPDLPVIGLSLHDNKEVADAMMRAGASVYVTKTEAFETLCSTIRQVTG